MKEACALALRQLKEADGSIAGGDGQSCATAIVLTTETGEAVHQEYVIYRAVYGLRPERQVLLQERGRHYDVLINGELRLYFDITAYWEHNYGRKQARRRGPRRK